MFETLTTDHYDTILDYLEGSKRNIKIVSPFLSLSLAKILCGVVRKNPELSCQFITRIYIEDMIAKANSLDAIRLMLEAGIEVYSVIGLHTKLYLFDDNRAILGSANFTLSGFQSNIELSLAIEEENELIEQLHGYFDDLLTRLKPSGKVTKEMFQEAEICVKDIFGAKKGSGRISSSIMLGADIGLIPQRRLKDSGLLEKEVRSAEKEARDIVTTLFLEKDRYNQIILDYNVWLKFTGTAEERHAADEMASVFGIETEQGRIYLSNYPRKATSVLDGDKIYIAALTTDKKGKQQPILVGRGTLRGFSEENEVMDLWREKYAWMNRYPWYCIIDTCEVLSTENRNGIPLDEVLSKFGSDTYISSFGRNESIADVSKKHYQKAHIRLSGNAMEYIDQRFDELARKYGSHIFQSA